MLIYREKLYFKSPIEHVFKCITSFEFNKQFFKNSLGKLDGRQSKVIKLKYDKKSDELTVLSDKPLFKIAPDRNEKYNYTSGMLVPLADALRIFGTAKIECWLSEQNGITEVYCEINSVRNPGIIWRIFAKIVVFVLKIKNREDTANYIKYVESSA